MTAVERQLVEPSRMRSAIARRMVASKREAPHFYVSTEVEMDAVWRRSRRATPRAARA